MSLNLFFLFDVVVFLTFCLHITRNLQVGEPSEKFYVIRQGKVRVLDSEDSEVTVLKESEWFGEMGLLNNGERVATCVAASPFVECFVLPKKVRVIDDLFIFAT